MPTTRSQTRRHNEYLEYQQQRERELQQHERECRAYADGLGTLGRLPAELRNMVYGNLIERGVQRLPKVLINQDVVSTYAAPKKDIKIKTDGNGLLVASKALHEEFGGTMKSATYTHYSLPVTMDMTAHGRSRQYAAHLPAMDHIVPRNATKVSMHIDLDHGSGDWVTFQAAGRFLTWDFNSPANFRRDFLESFEDAPYLEDLSITLTIKDREKRFVDPTFFVHNASLMLAFWAPQCEKLQRLSVVNRSESHIGWFALRDENQAWPQCANNGPQIHTQNPVTNHWGRTNDVQGTKLVRDLSLSPVYSTWEQFLRDMKQDWLIDEAATEMAEKIRQAAIPFSWGSMTLAGRT